MFTQEGMSLCNSDRHLKKKENKNNLNVNLIISHLYALSISQLLDRSK